MAWRKASMKVGTVSLALLALPARHACRAKRWFLGEEAVVRGERMSQRRALRRIERDLVRSDPRLDALFIELTGLGRDKEMPVTEQIPTGPHWLPARLGRRTRRRAGEDWRARPRTIR